MMRIAPFALVQTEVEGHGFIASPVARQKVIGDQMFQSSNGDGVCGGGGEPRQNESKAADDKPLSDASYKIQAGDFKAGGDLPVTIAFTANHGGAHMMSIACPAATDTSAQYKWTKMKLAASEKSQPHYWNGGAAAILGGGLETTCPFRTKWAGFGSSYKVNPKGWDDKWCSKGGESGCYHIANPEAPDTVKTVWTIPADFKDCPHAVVQWNWMTFNSGKPAEFESASLCPDKAGRVLSETDISEAELRLLKDPYEQFKNCFDIKVGGGAGGAASGAPASGAAGGTGVTTPATGGSGAPGAQSGAPGASSAAPGAPSAAPGAPTQPGAPGAPTQPPIPGNPGVNAAGQ